MNRRERPRMKHNAHDLVTISWGTLLVYACDAPHKAIGVALIEDGSGTTCVPLCDPCLDDKGHHVLKKYWGTPDLIVDEGGEATTEQLLALVERQGSVPQ